MPDEHRRRLRVDMLFDRNGVERFRIGLAVAEQRIETAAVGERAGRDHRVGEHQAVRAHRIRIVTMCREHVVAGGSRKIGGKVTAGGEADHRDRVGIAMPFVGMRTNPPHRFSRFQQRDREDGRFHGIAQHERVEAGCKELHGDWFGFAVGRHFVAAAGNHQHGRALAIRVDFAAVVKAVADERGRAAVDSGNFIFKITHDSMLSMACPKSC